MILHFISFNRKYRYWFLFPADDAPYIFNDNWFRMGPSLQELIDTFYTILHHFENVSKYTESIVPWNSLTHFHRISVWKQKVIRFDVLRLPFSLPLSLPVFLSTEAMICTDIRGNRGTSFIYVCDVMWCSWGLKIDGAKFSDFLFSGVKTCVRACASIPSHIIILLANTDISISNKKAVEIDVFSTNEQCSLNTNKTIKKWRRRHCGFRTLIYYKLYVYILNI